jgi:DNA polymerase-3 subunit gamma/tau
MSDLALYRKYRPKVFEDVLGQDHIVSVLKNEVEKNMLSHAYLFYGSRGTGKTTIARIFAREMGVSAEDIYEIDAASNRGIDDIRSIREAVNVLPYSSKYKVYIVDEVHMLTRDAWNAFLKTLEEPPAHAIFILATTEMHKLPDTVVSRCETFTFKKPSHTLLTETILKTAKAEGIKIERPSASLVANLAEGSFRDALSIFQKVVHLSRDNKLTHGEVEQVLGAPKESLVLEILESLKNSEPSLGIEAVSRASKENADMRVFLKMILRFLRFILLLRFAKEMKGEIKDEVGEDTFEKLSSLAREAKNITSKTLLTFLEAHSLSEYSEVPELPLEIAIINSCKEVD